MDARFRRAENHRLNCGGVKNGAAKAAAALLPRISLIKLYPSQLLVCALNLGLFESRRAR